MQNVVVFAFVGLLVWMISNLGIETALAFAAFVSGMIWLGYFLLNKTDKDEPLIVEYARSFFPIFFIVLVLRAFIVEPFRIPSGSMMPTLLVGDFILVNKFTYGIRLPVTKTKIIDLNEPERGDVVVFRYPANPRIDYIKRLIALPGDKVAYRNKVLFLNGKAHGISNVEPYQPIGSGMRAKGALKAIENMGEVEHDILVYPFVPMSNPRCRVVAEKEVVVPEGHYLVMGDNRDDSNDGRCWGFVPEENFVGKAFFIWLNFDVNRPGYIGWERIFSIID